MIFESKLATTEKLDKEELYKLSDMKLLEQKSAKILK